MSVAVRRHVPVVGATPLLIALLLASPGPAQAQCVDLGVGGVVTCDADDTDGFFFGNAVDSVSILSGVTVDDTGNGGNGAAGGDDNVFGIDGDIAGDFVNRGSVVDTGAPAETIDINGTIGGKFHNFGTIIGAEGGLEAGNIDGGFINDGLISAVDVDAIAEAVDIDDVTGDVVNNGTITAMAGTVIADGIEAGEISGWFVNNGTITAMAVDVIADTVETDDIYGSFLNNGLIEASAGNNIAEAVDVEDVQGDFINKGTITATVVNDNARAAKINNIVGDFVNSGTIVAIAGTGIARGVHTNNIGGSFTNSGLISATGVPGNAIEFSSVSGGLINSGTIIGSTNAILVSGGGTALTLLEGSNIQGAIEFGAPNNTLTFGPGLNATVQIDGSFPETINAANDVFVLDGNVVHAIDSTGFTAADQGVAALGAQVLAALDRLGPGTAAPAVTQGSAGTDGFAWGGAIGAVGLGGETDGSAAYLSATAGIIGGYAFDGDSGVFLGLTATHQESDSSFEADTNTAFAGLHGGWQMGGINVDASVTAGVGGTDQTRTIANNTVPGGLETANADYDTAFVMPAVTFSGDMDRGSDSFTPSLRLRYGKILQDGYDETGTATALQSVDDRTAEFLEVRVQVERGLEDKRVGDAQMTTRMRAGFDAQVFAGDNVDLTVVTQDLSFGIHDEDIVGRFFIGTDMVRLGDSGSELTAGFEAGIDTNQRIDVSGGVEWVLSF